MRSPRFLGILRIEYRERAPRHPKDLRRIGSARMVQGYLEAKTSRGLHILNLEDDPLDTNLIQANLAESEIGCELLRVQDRSAFVAALEEGDFDLILADHSLPGFDG